MKRLIVAAGLVAMLLAGCQTTTSGVVTPSTSAQVTIADGVTTVDTAYNAAAKVYLAAVPTMDPSLKAKVKPMLQQAKKFVDAADAAGAAGDATTLQSQTASALNLISQIKSLLPSQ